ncbi:MAG: FAD-dependent oxidoreductase [Bacteroidota bacterium]
MDADIVIAGAGLAGACAALALSKSHRVLVLEDGRPGASHAAAGLVNPFLGRKAKRAWRASDAVAEVARLGTEAGAPVALTGLLRPARDAAQAQVFRDRAAEHPAALDWLPAEASRERYPDVRAEHGALWGREGGHVEIPALVSAVLAEAKRRGTEVVRGRLDVWHDNFAITDQGRIQAERLLLCTGDGTRSLAPSLPLHRVKGQTVRFRLATDLSIPPVSGGTYVVPVTPREVVVGATFEHTFDSLAPTAEATEHLRERAASVVPALTEAEVVDARAGVRLTVPASVRPGRLPLVGPVAPGVWVFTGLGAKGLLTAPLLARHLPGWWDAPQSIWPEVSTLGLG